MMISTVFGIFLIVGICHCARLRSWSVRHSVGLPKPESEASLLFAVGLVRMSSVSSSSFSVNWTCGICAVF